MTTTDHRPSEVKQQAQQHADEARTSMDAQRSERDSGLTGWLNKRAGEWDLSGQDEATMQRQKYFWNTLVDYWFRMEFDGWENPARPAGAAGGHPLGSAVCVGRVDGRRAVVATVG
jgi:hypothetical protein